MTPLPSLIDIQQCLSRDLPKGKADEITVRRMWWAALETLQEDILLPMDPVKGLWIAAPLPALYEPRLLDRLQGWVWAPEVLNSFQLPSSNFLLPSRARSFATKPGQENLHFRRLPLKESDGREPLLIIITPEIQLALGLHGKKGERQLVMRCDQETISQLLKLLDLRMLDESDSEAIELRKAISALGPLKSNPVIERLFWPRLAERLALTAPSLNLQTVSEREFSSEAKNDLETSELMLLEALTHEVRTPLATIRTIIRSLLKREDLSDLVERRLAHIDTECTEQIDRFGLIFTAAELQRRPTGQSRLARTDLGAMLELMYPVTSSQLERRGVHLHLDITSDLPQVLSDPERLELMLGGLLDRTSRGLPPGGNLTLKLRQAGHRLKLQILSEISTSQDKPHSSQEQNSELGPVLSWNPNTGSLQLTRAATQRLLASLGGRLADRRDSRLTVFFPVCEGDL